jgi:predicted molibdopterin-dependent oxidoreductase YjgC
VPVKGQSRADCTIAAEIGGRVGLKLGKFPSQLFAEVARSYPAFNGLSYAEISKVEKQFPDVGGADLYYGGTSYTNEQGLGVQLTSGVERGMTVLPGRVEAPKHALGLQLMPVQVLYDRGTTFARTLLMHPRVPLPYIELNRDDARDLGVADGAEVDMIIDGRATAVAARVGGRAPKGVVLMPVHLGVDLPAGPAPVEIRVKEGARS